MFARRIAVGITAVACLLASAPTSASTPAWQVDVGRELAAIASSDAGVTVVVGRTLVDDRQKFLIAALDPSGATLWTKTFHPMRDQYSGSWGEAVTLDDQGRMYAVGNTWHCRYGCEAGFWFIRAYAADGTLRWTHGVRGFRDPRQWRATGIDTWARGVVVSGQGRLRAPRRAGGRVA